MVSKEGWVGREADRRINIEFFLIAPGKNRKQRSDCFFLIYTITTNNFRDLGQPWTPGKYQDHGLKNR